MNGKSKSLFTLTGTAFISLAAVAILSVSSVSLEYRSVFCGNVETVAFDPELPVSHPVNKCAMHNQKGVSWSSWMTGRSSSYQFHFIDLLELLSRSSESAPKNTTGN